MISRISWVAFFLFGQVLFSQADVSSIGVLPGEVIETSGLIFHNNKLITHNDSGNTPQLFEIDTISLEVTRVVSLSNVENNDWEDLAHDEDYIYIGDFGNNQGNRTNLAIYRVSKADYNSSDTVMADIIEFTYEDQADFSGGQPTDWDAEAIVALENELIVFTKQWQSNGTVAYSIPKLPGVYEAQNLGSYDSAGLITGATYNPNSQLIYLVGYSQQLQPFIIRIDGVDNEFNFDGNIVKSSLQLGFAQIESITNIDENTYYLTSEYFTNANPPITLDSRLFRFSTEDTTPEEPNPEEPPPGEGEPEEPGEGMEGEGIIVFISPGTKELHYILNIERELFGRAIFDTAGRKLELRNANEIGNNSIDLSIFESSIYFLTFYFEGRTISKPFFLD